MRLVAWAGDICDWLASRAGDGRERPDQYGCAAVSNQEESSRDLPRATMAAPVLPILTYWISVNAGRAQGWELSKQTAAASLGVIVGSAVGGLFFNIAGFPGASFVLIAALTALGVLRGFGLPNLLLRRSASEPLPAT